MTAADLLAGLRRHYIPDARFPGGVFAPEIAAPDSQRRADLIWLGVTAATGREIVGHEVKVTRQDLAAELADPAKAAAWQQYCDRWWLVVPDPALLHGHTIPDTWGVLTPPRGRRTRPMTVHRPAPRLSPAPQEPALRTITAWLHWRHHRLSRQLGRAQVVAREGEVATARLPQGGAR